MLCESNESRNVLNGCLNLQNFHNRGYGATVLALPRLYPVLRRWVERERKATTDKERKEVQRVVKELEETTKVLCSRRDVGGSTG